MRVFAVDPDRVGGWALVSSVGPKPVVLHSGVLEDATVSQKFALLMDFAKGAHVVIEYVFPGIMRGNDTLMRTGYEWEALAKLVVGEKNVSRMQAISWRKSVGLPTKGKKSGSSKAANDLRVAVRLAAMALTENVAANKAELRQIKGAELYQDSESDAVCIAVAYFAKQEKQDAVEENSGDL